MLENFLFDTLLGPILVAVLIVVALQKILDVTKKMSGEFGDLGSKIAGTALGVAGGVTVGGAARLGRVAIGGTAAKILDSDRLQKLASSKGWVRATGISTLAQGGVLAANKAKDSTFDVRNVGGAAGKGIGALGMGKGGKLGYVKEEEAFIKEQKKRAALFEVGNVEKGRIEKEAEAKRPAAIEAITQSKAKMTEASKKVTDAQASIDFAKTMGALDPNLEKVLELAKKEEAEAKEALEKAVEEQSKIKTAEEVIKEENERRRGIQAKQIALLHKPFSSADRKELRKKIREGKTPKEKEEEDLSKILEKLAKKMPKEEKESEESGAH